MGMPVVTVASGGMPVIDVTATTGRGTPVTEATNGFGRAVTKVTSGGMAVAYETLVTWPPVTPPVVYAAFDPATLIDTALSNNNLTATHTTANANSGARVVPMKTAGQFYFEIKLIIGNGSFDGFGLLSAGITYNNFILSSTNCVAVSRGGGINTNGVNLANIGAFAPNDVLGIAVDLTAHLVWCRRNAGLWNNSAGANPATAIGGLAAPAVGMAPGVCFVGSGTAINDGYTANFGATAFANTAPSGFTGWTA